MATWLILTGTGKTQRGKYEGTKKQVEKYCKDHYLPGGYKIEMEIPKTRKFNGKVYELITETKPKTKAAAEFTVASWRSRGRDRGARAVKVEGGYVVYVRGG